MVAINENTTATKETKWIALIGPNNEILSATKDGADIMALAQDLQKHGIQDPGYEIDKRIRDQTFNEWVKSLGYTIQQCSIQLV